MTAKCKQPKVMFIGGPLDRMKRPMPPDGSSVDVLSAQVDFETIHADPYMASHRRDVYHPFKLDQNITLYVHSTLIHGSRETTSCEVIRALLKHVRTKREQTTDPMSRELAKYRRKISRQMGIPKQFCS